MITTTIDVSAIADLGKRFITMQQADSLLRSISTGMLAETSKRIHKRGENTDGSPIGEYSDSYLKLRQSKFNRTADKKVVLSLTRQMENDYKVIALSDTEYALGFDNQFNADKAEWAEDGTDDATVKAHTRTVNGKKIEVKSHSRKGREGYGKIWALTDQELDQVRAIVKEFINNTFED